MTTFRTAEDVRAMRIVAGGLIGGAVLFLAIAMFMRTFGGMGGSLEILTWLACAFALISPVLGVVVGAQTARNPTSDPGTDPRKSAFLVMYGQMEASVLFCAVALMVGPSAWPLAAALVPLAVMAVQFPRAEVPRTG